MPEERGSRDNLWDSENEVIKEEKTLNWGLNLLFNKFGSNISQLKIEMDFFVFESIRSQTNYEG